MTLSFLLKSIGACSEGVKWRSKRDLKTAWAECERGDWMLWLCGKMVGKKGWPARQEIILVTCDCAELSLPIFENKYPNDDRPRKAIETARLWASGKSVIKEVRRSAKSAPCYVSFAAAYYASCASFAAAYAALAARDTAHDAGNAAAYSALAVAFAASTAGSVADGGEAKTSTLRKCADICRSKLKVPAMKA